MDLTFYSSDAGEREMCNSDVCCTVNGQLELPAKFKNKVTLKLDIWFEPFMLPPLGAVKCNENSVVDFLLGSVNIFSVAPRFLWAELAKIWGCVWLQKKCLMKYLIQEPEKVRWSLRDSFLVQLKFSRQSATTATQYEATTTADPDAWLSDQSALQCFNVTF